MRTWQRIGLLVGLLAGAGATAFATVRPNKDVCNHFFANLYTQQGVKRGDWGNIPKELQKLPPGAKLCGTTGFVTVVASPLEGKALGDYYKPLMSSAGCPDLTCKINDIQTDCTCQHKNRWGSNAQGRILTEAGLEAYKLFY